MNIDPSSGPASSPPPLPGPPPILGQNAPRPIGWGLGASVVAVGVLLFGMAISSVARVPEANPARRLGMVIGMTCFWPMIFMGLFAIGRRFRRRRPQAVILLCVWSVSLLSVLVSPVNRTGRHDADESSSGSRGSQRIEAARVSAAPVAPVTHFDLTLPDTDEEPLNPFLRHDPPASSTKPTSQIAAAPRYDFSRGSDERLYTLIESAQSDRYHDVVAAYGEAIAAHPANAELAVERARFIARFTDVEDNTIASAPDDYEMARQYLETHFPHAPAAVLFRLERLYGEPFETLSRASVGEVSQWSMADAARYWLLRAERAEGAETARRDAAQRSYDLHHTAAAAILLAESDHALKRDDDAIAVLRDGDLFKGATDWMHVRRMRLLFALHQSQAALQEYAYVRQHLPGATKTFEVAKELALAGRVDEARKIVGELGNRPEATQARARFDFELLFGTKSDAVRAYRALRAQGAATDPLLRQRFSLQRRFPTAPILATDLIGMMTIALLVMAVLALAGLLLLPIHYWSLARRSRSVLTIWRISPWGLTSVWLLSAVVGCIACASAWYFSVEAAAMGKKAAEQEKAALLPTMAWIWGIVALIVLVSIARRRAWALFGGGAWGWRRCLGLGALLGIGTVFVAGVYARIFHLTPTPSALTSSQLVVFKAAYAHIGGWGLFVLAGWFIPVWEETVMRGVLFGALAKHIPTLAANILQSLLFACLHDSLALFPIFFAIGFVCGELVRRSGSLLPGIALHVVNNSIFIGALLALNSRTHLF